MPLDFSSIQSAPYRPPPSPNSQNNFYQPRVFGRLSGWVAGCFNRAVVHSTSLTQHLLASQPEPEKPSCAEQHNRALQLQTLERELADWVARSSEGGVDRKAAAKRIRDAFNENKESLNLCGHSLRDLPKGLENLTKLTTLNLCNNNFPSLPEEILILPLEALYLSHNPFNSLDGVERLSFLKELEVDGLDKVAIHNYVAALAQRNQITVITQNRDFALQLRNHNPDRGKVRILFMKPVR